MMSLKTITIEKLQVGHNSAEIYFRFDDYVVIIPPTTAKKLLHSLAELNLPEPASVGTKNKKNRKRESVARQVIRALYKGRKVTSNLISVNTGRKKKPPDN